MEKSIRVLIIGDSWANTIRKGGISGISEKNPFTKALLRHGFTDIDTAGDKTVWAGMRSDDFYTDEKKQLIENELIIHKELVAVHMIVGGNDFLHEAVGASLLNKSETEIVSYLEEISARIESLVKFIASAKPDISVLFCGYDYVDIMKAGQIIGFDTSDLTFELFNYWFQQLNRSIKTRISSMHNCRYIDNMGCFHALSNTPHSQELYREPIEKCYKNDGIHPNNLGNRIILDKCFKEFYDERLRKV